MSVSSYGRYYIVNNVTTPYGPLAVHYNGVDKKVDLTRAGTECGTVWNITAFDDGTQSVSPDGHPSVRAVNVDGILQTIYDDSTTWAIGNSSNMCTFEDSKEVVYWEVQEAKPGQEVAVSAAGEGLQQWLCLKVPVC